MAPRTNTTNPYPVADIGVPWTSQQLYDFLIQNGILQPTPSGSLSKTQLKAIAEDYAKATKIPFSEVYDEVTPKFADNATMQVAFQLIDSGYVPSEVESRLMSEEISLSDTEIQGLKDYYDMSKKRKESAAEREYDLGSLASDLGISAERQFDIPTDVFLKNFRTLPGQDKPISAMAKQEAMKVYNDLREVNALRDRFASSSKDTSNFSFGTDPAAWLFNKTFGNLPGVGRVTKNVEQQTPAPLSAGREAAIKRYEALQAIADTERQKDIEGKQRLIDMLTSAFGSPLEKQILDVALGGTYGGGNGSGGSNDGTSSSSSSNRRKDTEPVPHTDRYSEWAIKNWSSLLHNI